MSAFLKASGPGAFEDLIDHAHRIARPGELQVCLGSCLLGLLAFGIDHWTENVDHAAGNAIRLVETLSEPALGFGWLTVRPRGNDPRGRSRLRARRVVRTCRPAGPPGAAAEGRRWRSDRAAGSRARAAACRAGQGSWWGWR